jgi:RND family efflux transporter MFP subunit
MKKQWFNAAMTLVPALSLALGAVSARAGSVDGFTEPYRKIDVAPSEPGTLKTLAVREGEHVRQGQLLAALDCEVLRVSLEIAQAAIDSRGPLDSAAAEVDLRRGRLEKMEELRSRNHASQEEVDRARTDLKIAQAALLAAQEKSAIDQLEYKKIEAMIERRQIRSPIDGVVVRIFKEEGEFVAATTPTVLTVVQLNPLRIVFSVPTALAAGLKAGRKMPLVFLDAQHRAEGQVEFVAPIADAESGTVRVKVLLNNPQGAYRCGVRCSLEIDDGPAAFRIGKP